MARQKKTWVYSPSKPQKKSIKIPDKMKQYLQEKGDEIVENIFKPEYLTPVPEKQTLNHIVDIYTKWYRNYFYFCAKYQCPPDSNSRSSSFESKFVRLEYLGDDKFQYSEMRHTGQWLPTFKMTADKCLELVAAGIPY